MLSSSPAAACGPEPYLGEICITAASYCPTDNYVLADGRELPVMQNQALFSVIGNMYGGDNTKFNVPNLLGRLPVGLGNSGTPGSANLQQGIKIGSDAITLSVVNIPAHSHTATVTAGTASGLSASVAIPAVNATANTDVPGTTVNLAKPVYPNTTTFADEPVKAYSDATTTPTTLKPFAAPVSGSISGLNVVVGPTGSGAPFVPRPPETVLRFCIAINGLYPPRN